MVDWRATEAVRNRLGALSPPHALPSYRSVADGPGPRAAVGQPTSTGGGGGEGASPLILQ